VVAIGAEIKTLASVSWRFLESSASARRRVSAEGRLVRARCLGIDRLADSLPNQASTLDRYGRQELETRENSVSQ
jgi:hypothetical protein